jgi:hypothetical protein
MTSMFLPNLSIYGWARLMLSKMNESKHRNTGQILKPRKAIEMTAEIKGNEL